MYVKYVYRYAEFREGCVKPEWPYIDFTNLQNRTLENQISFLSFNHHF